MNCGVCGLEKIQLSGGLTDHYVSFFDPDSGTSVFVNGSEGVAGVYNWVARVARPGRISDSVMRHLGIPSWRMTAQKDAPYPPYACSAHFTLAYLRSR